MLVKTAEDRTCELAELEAQAERADSIRRKRLQQEIRLRRAGLKGEADSAYHIDFHFAQSRNWAVLHDLRIEHEGRVAQLDHLLVNRFLEIYVLETKHFHSGLKITEEGEFLRWNDYKKTFEGMPSPLMQNERHIEVLRGAVERIELPTRLGMRLKPTFQTLVLVSPSARVDRPKKLDTSRVIKADQLKERLWKDIDEENGLVSLFTTLPKLVASETVEQLARSLAALHVPQAWSPARPSLANALADDPALEVQPARQVAQAAPTMGPACKACSAVTGAILHGKYGYYFKCGACEVNTAIRFTCAPGHSPRLRKQGPEFFRECGDCGTSELYFRSA
jgi:hypothetical protein